MNAMQRNNEVSEFKEKLVAVNRVSKTVKGGRNMRFSTLMIVGDENGRVGCGMGKAAEIPEAIKKGVEDAKKNMTTIAMDGTTIPHEVVGVFGKGRVKMIPAPEGTGVIALAFTGVRTFDDATVRLTELTLPVVSGTAIETVSSLVAVKSHLAFKIATVESETVELAKSALSNTLLNVVPMLSQSTTPTNWHSIVSSSSVVGKVKYQTVLVVLSVNNTASSPVCSAAYVIE